MKIPYNWLKEYIKTDLSPKEISERLTMAGHALDKPIEDTPDSRSQSAPAGQTPGVDYVMDFEDRGNRADVAGIVGLARDLSALIGIKLEYPRTSVIPPVNNDKFQPKIAVESGKVVRWRAVVFKNIKVGPSPDLIQQRLKAYGIEVINNVVDITNYIMIELGMPLHAFDLDKVGEIILRPAKKGETLVTFEGTTLKFDENDLLAADKNKPLTLTTAVGGRESGVSKQTINVLIEAGLYDQPTARRSALRLNVRNETAQRLGKHLHPQFCEEAVARAVYLMKEITNTDPEPISYDYYPNKYPEITIAVSRERLNMVAGEEIDLKEAERILKSLGFETTLSPRHPELVSGSRNEFGMTKDEEVKSLTVKVPYFRTDVTLEEDVIEEILRLRGYDKIPSFLPNRPAPAKLVFPEMDLENKLRDEAVKLGYTETISQQIIDIRDTEKTGLLPVIPNPSSVILSKTKDLNINKIIKLENSWNEELNILRPEMVSPQLKYFYAYEKRGFDPIKIFEAAKTYSQDPLKKGYEKYIETRKFVLTSSQNYLAFKADLETLLGALGIKNYEFAKIDFPIFKKQFGAQIIHNGLEIGKFGEMRGQILSKFGIDGDACHAVFYVSQLLKAIDPGHLPEISTKNENYISEDFTFKVGADRLVGDLVKIFTQKLDKTSRFDFVGVYEDEKLKKENKKNVTFNFKFNSDKAKDESRILRSINL